MVAAAGNLGKTDDGRPIVGGVISPGNTPSALTVGALNTQGDAQRSDDVMATYSSRGPTRVRRRAEAGAGGAGQQDRGAVGGGLVSGADVSGAGVAGLGANAYIEMSGTSMAAAVVSGAAALLLRRESVADAGGGQAGAAADELAGGRRRVDRSGRREPERRRRGPAWEGTRLLHSHNRERVRSRHQRWLS